MASTRDEIDYTTEGLDMSDQANAEKDDYGEYDDSEAPAHQPLRSENHLNFDRGEPSSSLVDLLQYVKASSGGRRYQSQVDELVEKSSKAIYLTQKTSLKIALLIDAIIKKQSSFFRRLTGKVKPDPDVVAFQEYLDSLQQQEDLWSKICSSTLSNSHRVKKDLAEHPEVFKAMSQFPLSFKVPQNRC